MFVYPITSIEEIFQMQRLNSIGCDIQYQTTEEDCLLSTGYNWERVYV